MNLHDERLRDKLAAGYALGTLKGGARRRFETHMQNNAALRRSVAEWQDRLQPMAQFSRSAAPAPHVWRAIEQRLQLRGTGGQSPWRGLLDNLRFWRGLGLASTALAGILVALLLTRQADTIAPPPIYVATLADDKAQAAMLITGDPQRRQLTVRLIAATGVASDKSLELWAVPKEGPPRSLGLVATNGIVTLPLPAGMTPQNIPLLAISLEPRGGSPNRQAPTGPILYKGAWLQV